MLIKAGSKYQKVSLSLFRRLKTTSGLFHSRKNKSIELLIRSFNWLHCEDRLPCAIPTGCHFEVISLAHFYSVHNACLVYSRDFMRCNTQGKYPQSRLGVIHFPLSAVISVA